MKITEAVERDKKRKNLVIMGIKESTGEEYKVEVEDLVKDLMDGIYVKFTVGERIGKASEGKCRPIRITVEDLSHKRRILAKAQI